MWVSKKFNKKESLDKFVDKLTGIFKIIDNRHQPLCNHNYKVIYWKKPHTRYEPYKETNDFNHPNSFWK